MELREVWFEGRAGCDAFGLQPSQKLALPPAERDSFAEATVGAFLKARTPSVNPQITCASL